MASPLGKSGSLLAYWPAAAAVAGAAADPSRAGERRTEAVAVPALAECCRRDC